MRLSSRELLSIGHTEVRKKHLLKGKKITGVSTDSRSTARGDVFVALRGEHFDGHKFLKDVAAKGAVVVVVENSGDLPEMDLPMIVVENTTHALGELAAVYRSRFKIPVLAIGGSNGKTTTKEMVAAVLDMEYNVLKTESNFNNHIGVPHTLFRLQKRHDVAVVEIGTNHPGEIAYLCSVAQPTCGLVTNVGREHLEFFTNLDGVAEEETTVYRFLAERKKSRVFVNADDSALVVRSKKLKRAMRYGFTTRSADVRGTLHGTDESGRASFSFRFGKQKKQTTVQLGIPGEHHALNALAAATVGHAFKVSPKKIRKALESFRPAGKRMELLNLGGVLIYNDAYNANPDSMIAALKTLSASRVPGKRIAVLGDMRELGACSAEEHKRVGAAMRGLRIDYLLTLGADTKHMHGEAGIQISVHYDQKNILAEYLAELIAPGDAVLIKGSRGMKMEDVVTFLEERLRSAVVPFG